MITRQAICRWENGETEPNIETLKLISKTFNVSINTLLNSPRALIYQVCGMDESISKDEGGHFDEDFFKWYFISGTHQYDEGNFDELIGMCVKSMIQVNPDYPEEQIRMMLKTNLPKLKYWKKKYPIESFSFSRGIFVCPNSMPMSKSNKIGRQLQI